MKVAIFGCTDLRIIGGAERLILNTAKALNADLIVLDAHKRVIDTYGIDVKIITLDKKISTEPFGTIVGKRIFERIDCRDEYDFFIAMDHNSMFALRKHKPNLFYCQGPRRELYDMYNVVVNSQGNLFMKYTVKLWLNILRIADQRFVKNYVNNIVCISHNVRNRVYKFYQKDAWVVYPPTHAKLYKYASSEGYWLSVNRLDNWKRIGLQVEAFRRLSEKRLKIVGTVYETPLIKKIISNLPDNIEIMHTVSEKELRELYSRCEGLLATSIDEDFGLTPVEAMASGKPVVAVKEGGYLETVLDGITGKLVAPRVESLINGILEVSERSETYRDACLQRAKLFDYEVFKRNFKEIAEFIEAKNR